MTGLHDTDIRLDEDGQLTQAADGDAPLCSGMDCFLQSIILEAQAQKGELFYDEDFGWSLYDFLQSEDDEITRLEITQRVRSGLLKREEIIPDSVQVQVGLIKDAFHIYGSFQAADTEDDESARERTLRSWSELALVPLRDTYINVCSAIAGVLYVTVKDQHPRGQGTVDIIITSEAGTATEDLLEKCRVACEEIREPDTDVKVKSAEIVAQDVAVTVTVSSALSQDGLAERVQASVTDLLKLRNRGDSLNELTHADIIHKIKSDVSTVRNVTVTTPAADVTLAEEKVIMAGKITVTVKGV